MAELIFNYCGINHTYNPEKRKNFFARTASKNQVNKDVHTASIGKKSFESFKEEFQNYLENQREYWIDSKQFNVAKMQHFEDLTQQFDKFIQINHKNGIFKID